ncbi:MAG TPA: alanine racemase [Acidimicrobiales bacterium]|jgi:alanine racemase|nr:alanine racemase [Acidimicrobiales bacterium]
MARAWAEIDLGAVRHNVRTLRALAAPARLCVVVKANGYGHGAVPVGMAAVEAGADWLAVAQVDELVGLRDAGVEAPLLLLAEPRLDEIDGAVATDARLTVYSPHVIAAVAKAVRARRSSAVPVHLKVDTGMHRVGVAPDEAVAVARSVRELAELRLEGVCTHMPVADEPDNPFSDDQVARFDAVITELRDAGIHPAIVHMANSAGTIAHPKSRYDLVRCGIAAYGIPPAPELDGAADLRPALTLASEVAFVKPVAAGERISYGHRHTFSHDTVVATVPIGYADGVFRSLPLAGQEVLVRGERRPITGVVTMDQLMVDCGPGSDVAAGEEVVLLGQQGDERITPDEWAGRMGTISYEVICAIGSRVVRRYR